MLNHERELCLPVHAFFLFPVKPTGVLNQQGYRHHPAHGGRHGDVEIGLDIDEERTRVIVHCLNTPVAGPVLVPPSMMVREFAPLVL